MRAAPAAPFPQSFILSFQCGPATRPGARLFKGVAGLFRPYKRVYRPSIGPIEARAGPPAGGLRAPHTHPHTKKAGERSRRTALVWGLFRVVRSLLGYVSVG